MAKPIGLISKKISEKQFSEVKNVFASLTGNQHVYDSKEVDGFLEEVGNDVKTLEGAAKKWYQELQDNIKKQQEEEEKAKSNQTAEEEQLENVELSTHMAEVTQAATEQVKNLPEGIAKVQGHMVAFLEQAEERSSLIVQEALAEKEKILREADRQSREIMETAFDEASKVKRQLQEQIEQSKNSKELMDLKAKEVQQEILKKAERVQRFGREFEEYGSSLRDIASTNDQKRA